MKLNKEHFKKMEFEGGMLYQYTCNETDFFLLYKKNGGKREISVFKGSVDDRSQAFVTSDSLAAWNKFEEMLKECEPQQGSSGGFKKNPQQTPQVIPLFAIKKTNTGFSIALFGHFTNGQQETAFEFEVSEDALTYPFPNKVFVVDWSNEEIPALIKCEIILKSYPDVVFKDDEEREVFLFVPKSIVQQGGEEGGNPDPEGDPDGEPDPDAKPDGKGKPSDKKTEGKGKPSDEKPDDTDGEPDPDENPENEGGEPSDKGNPNGEQRKEDENKKGDDGKSPLDDISPSEVIIRLSELTNVSPSVIANTFRKVTNGETFLLVNNFPQIKNALNLPQSTTARELSQQIVKTLS